MKIAVINEVSARSKNIDIVKGLEKNGITPYNVGMTAENHTDIELTYIHTGLMAGILLNLGAVDMVVGGCGTGQGFLVSAMQYPQVFCGLIIEPLDAWLFSQINAGNCVSLPLNKGYGWAGNINLEYIFEKLFKDSLGAGYPTERASSQAQSRKRLSDISNNTHRNMEQILLTMDKGITQTVFSHKPFAELIVGGVKNTMLQKFILNNFKVNA